MYGCGCTKFILSLGVLLSPLCFLTSTLPITDVGLEEQVQEQQNTFILCQPLHAQGTAVLCFPPAQQNENQNTTLSSTDCSEGSVPGTIASYTCRNFKEIVYQGYLGCSSSGIWTISLTHANNSLCNLDASIVNFEVPDIMTASDIPGFTTPIPDRDLLQPDVSFLNEYEKVALQLHNVFRRNHGIPMVAMAKELNVLAQKVAEGISPESIVEPPEPKWNPLNRTMNFEMNWYFQVPPSLDPTEAVSNAIQTWYSGFFTYDWNNAENILEEESALAFARLIWKTTQLIGVGVSNSGNLTFVVCVYTPGRNIAATDPAHEFMVNVSPVRVG